MIGARNPAILEKHEPAHAKRCPGFFVVTTNKDYLPRYLAKKVCVLAMQSIGFKFVFPFFQHNEGAGVSSRGLRSSVAGNNCENHLMDNRTTKGYR